MDPLTVTVSVLGGIQTVFILTKALKGYIDDTRTAKDDLKTVVSDIEVLFHQIDDLEKLLEENKSSGFWNKFAVDRTRKCISDGYFLVSKLGSILLKSGAALDENVAENIDKSVFSPLKWPLYRPKVKELKLELILLKLDVGAAYTTYRAPSGSANDRQTAQYTSAQYDAQREKYMSRLQVLKERRLEIERQQPGTGSDISHGSQAQPKKLSRAANKERLVFIEWEEAVARRLVAEERLKDEEFVAAKRKEQEVEDRFVKKIKEEAEARRKELVHQRITMEELIKDKTQDISAEKTSAIIEDAIRTLHPVTRDDELVRAMLHHLSDPQTQKYTAFEAPAATPGSPLAVQVSSPRLWSFKHGPRTTKIAQKGSQDFTSEVLKDLSTSDGRAVLYAAQLTPDPYGQYHRIQVDPHSIWTTYSSRTVKEWGSLVTSFTSLPENCIKAVISLLEEVSCATSKDFTWMMLLVYHAQVKPSRGRFMIRKGAVSEQYKDATFVIFKRQPRGSMAVDTNTTAASQAGLKPLPNTVVPELKMIDQSPRPLMSRVDAPLASIRSEPSDTRAASRGPKQSLQFDLPEEKDRQQPPKPAQELDVMPDSKTQSKCIYLISLIRNAGKPTYRIDLEGNLGFSVFNKSFDSRGLQVSWYRDSSNIRRILFLADIPQQTLIGLIRHNSARQRFPQKSSDSTFQIQVGDPGDETLHYEAEVQQEERNVSDASRRIMRHYDDTKPKSHAMYPETFEAARPSPNRSAVIRGRRPVMDVPWRQHYRPEYLYMTHPQEAFQLGFQTSGRAFNEQFDIESIKETDSENSSGHGKTKETKRQQSRKYPTSNQSDKKSKSSTQRRHQSNTVPGDHSSLPPHLQDESKNAATNLPKHEASQISVQSAVPAILSQPTGPGLPIEPYYTSFDSYGSYYAPLSYASYPSHQYIATGQTQVDNKKLEEQLKGVQDRIEEMGQIYVAKENERDQKDAEHRAFMQTRVMEDRRKIELAEAIYRAASEQRKLTKKIAKEQLEDLEEAHHAQIQKIKLNSGRIKEEKAKEGALRQRRYHGAARYSNGGDKRQPHAGYCVSNLAEKRSQKNSDRGVSYPTTPSDEATGDETATAFVDHERCSTTGATTRLNNDNAAIGRHHPDSGSPYTLLHEEDMTSEEHLSSEGPMFELRGKTSRKSEGNGVSREHNTPNYIIWQRKAYAHMRNTRMQQKQRPAKTQRNRKPARPVADIDITSSGVKDGGAMEITSDESSGPISSGSSNAPGVFSYLVFDDDESSFYDSDKARQAAGRTKRVNGQAYARRRHLYRGLAIRYLERRVVEAVSSTEVSSRTLRPETMRIRKVVWCCNGQGCFSDSSSLKTIMKMKQCRVDLTTKDGISTAPVEWSAARLEQLVDLLKTLARRLRIAKEGLHGGAETQHAEDDEGLVGDVLEGGRDEETQRKVEEPVGDGGERHAVAARVERPDLGGVDPRDGGEGERVDDDEQVGERDDRVGCRARHLDGHVGVGRVADAAGDGGTVASKDAANDKMAYAHADGAVDEEWSTADFVDEEVGDEGEDYEGCILYARSDEVMTFAYAYISIMNMVQKSREDPRQKVVAMLGRRHRQIHNHRIGLVATGLDVGKNGKGFLVAANLGEPPGGTGEEGETGHQESNRNPLNCPCDTERRRAGAVADEAAAVADEEHDQNADLDGKLLNDDDGATLVLLGDLGQVDGDLRRGDADADTVEHAAGNELANAGGGDLNRGTNDPPQTGKCDRVAATKAVRDGTGHQRTNDRATGKGRANATLDDAGRVVEVGNILARNDNGAQGRNVKAKKHATLSRCQWSFAKGDSDEYSRWWRQWPGSRCCTPWES
ncbi:hypothetical protein FH972_024435 [Carpinus fangiana]|uniref:Fungal N-terminal domain-containing protein n=1 Tax=Carpinus fangiana TaxID=176857 RepID=A0A5N6KY14_9ROSI|nr:hypothetical protein FH972_024435 [Carpinus fangiana]